MTLGEQIAAKTQVEVIEGQAQKPITKIILRRCLSSLRRVIDDVASPDCGKQALPACYGRHVIFASSRRGMVADMMQWADAPKMEVSDLGDRAALWATLATYIHKGDVDAAFVALGIRLGVKGIEDFEASFARLDNSLGEIVFDHGDHQSKLVTRGAMVVLAGIESGASAGIVGALAVPVYVKPGPVANWHDSAGWSADGNHRRLH